MAAPPEYLLAMKIKESDIGAHLEYRPLCLSDQEQKVILVELISARPGDARVKVLLTGEVISVFPASLAIPGTIQDKKLKSTR